MKIRIRFFLVLGLTILVAAWKAHAQGSTVSGRVTGPDGNALPGVSIILKNTQRGTTSDADGRYSLPNVQATNGQPAVLTFSFIGYVSQDVTVGNRTTIDLTLQTDDRSLNEVVVVGYGTQRKIETTGSIASVKSTDLVQTPVANVAQGLQARVSGVQVTQNSGAPGGNVSVRIRGTNSINGNSEPLYIVDGIQISNSNPSDNVTTLSPLSTINPNDVESIEVLKDASATAIYGSRAANGVVLITTKRGRAGATRITYDGYYGVQKAAKTLPVLSAAEFGQLENEVFRNNFYQNPASLGEGVNWQNLIFRQAPIQSHQLSITGGSEKTQLSLSGNYFNQDGIIIASNFKRYSYRINVDHKINNRLKIGTSILGTYAINNGVPYGSTSLGDADVVSSSILGAALGAPPTLQPYRPDGSVFPFGEQANGQYREVTNPLGLAAVMNQTNIRRTLANFFADATLLKGLNYRASFNIDLQNSLRDTYSPRSIVSRTDLNDNSGSGSKINSNSTVLLHESILTYNTTLAERHSLKFTGVFATQSNLYNTNTINATGFPNDATGDEALQLALARTVNSYRSKEGLDSYLGRINYGYRDRYFLDLTARIDGSSKFGANHKYGFFPAIAGAWRIIDEPFLKNVNWLSDLKLRGSWGITGNAGGINPYQSLATVSSSGSDYQFNHTYLTGINPSGIANPDLRWEKSAQTDIGLDIGLLNNRLSFIVDVYQKTTRDLLYVRALPLSSGYATITGNFASLQNKGIELAANARILQGALKWDVSANATINRNKVLDLDGGTTQERFVTTYSILSVGQPLGLFKTYVFDGINQSGETILPGYDGRLGGHKLKDINGDGQITAADQVITGNPNPKLIFGFSTNLAYKNFDFSAFLSGSQGNDIYNQARFAFETPLGQRNLLKGVANRWSATNPNQEYASAAQGSRLPVSDRFVEDGSYLRCKNITLGYTLPQIKGIQRIRFYASVNNLFTITKYSGFDPEVNSYAGSNTVLGVDNLVYPPARSVLGGLQVTF
ncbi:TonB-dependent receptor [Spirosoma sp. RP8]|uniref:TonB-dependent receptor n=1 Tax=Spirosoma liriopis TaxID=2937440 RepID=A0ABT0HJU5_9BACT|nr:TonB-dependent receptor [Spirosoma liriopis]MCK8492439.1 TonB-dependent receptor [Spirosoma liriopis]